MCPAALHGHRRRRLVRVSGYTATPTCLPGEPFALKVASPLEA
jgi:hypothetical protein